jgi:hypothetical protein
VFSIQLAVLERSSAHDTMSRYLAAMLPYFIAQYKASEFILPLPLMSLAHQAAPLHWDSIVKFSLFGTWIDGSTIDWVVAYVEEGLLPTMDFIPTHTLLYAHTLSGASMSYKCGDYSKAVGAQLRALLDETTRFPPNLRPLLKPTETTPIWSYNPTGSHWVSLGLALYASSIAQSTT